LRPVRTPAQPPAPRPAPAEDEEEDEKAELPKPPQKAEPKPEPKREDLTKILEEKKREEEKARAEAQKAAEEKRKADERRQAEQNRKAQAEKKAREEREKRQRGAAEAQRLEDQIRQRLLTSREAPASTGATGAAVQRQASLGTETATGQKLSPNERSQLIGILTEQMNRCLNIPPGAIPRSKPIVQLTLARDGSIISGPTLLNPVNESGYMPYAEANMRALRNCAPFRIPARFLSMYNDWKTLRIGFDPSEMQ
jgi:colicin import membrane protein